MMIITQYAELKTLCVFYAFDTADGVVLFYDNIIPFLAQKLI